MFVQQRPISNNLGVMLGTTNEGNVFFNVPQGFVTVIDQCPPEIENGVSGVFDKDGFKLGDEEFLYGTLYGYKNIPVMAAWLKQQNM